MRQVKLCDNRTNRTLQIIWVVICGVAVGRGGPGAAEPLFLRLGAQGHFPPTSVCLQPRVSRVLQLRAGHETVRAILFT